MKTKQKLHTAMITVFSLVILCVAAIVAILAAFVWVSPMIFFLALAAACFSLDALKNCKEDSSKNFIAKNLQR